MTNTITATFDPLKAFPFARYPSVNFPPTNRDREPRRRSKTFNGRVPNKHKRVNKLKSDIQSLLIDALRNQGVIQ